MESVKEAIMLIAQKHSKPANQPDFSDRKQRFYDFLTANRIGVLSTVTPDGDPHGVVIYFDIDHNFAASFITRNGTKKYDNLRHNNHVMLTVFEPKKQAVVHIAGTATEITDIYELKEIAAATLAISLSTSETGQPPITKLEAGEFVGFKIAPKYIRMAVYARPQSGQPADLFESLESFELEPT